MVGREGVDHSRSVSSTCRVEPGQVVFCQRPSLLQRWGELVGSGTWRHVGLIVDTPQGLMMAGFGRTKRYCLIPAERLLRYSRVGVATVLESDDEVRQLHRWVRQYEDDRAGYTTSAVIIGGLYSACRALCDGLALRIGATLIRAYAALQSRRYRTRQSFVCSTFVLAALNAASNRPIHVPMTGPSKKRSRGRAITLADIEIARWVVSPTDLWETIDPARRADLDLDGWEASTTFPGSTNRDPVGFDT